jgi:hypothetical protein
MLKYYKTLSLLFEFPAIPKNNKKHWSDNSSWAMAKFMQEFMHMQAKL